MRASLPKHLLSIRFFRRLRQRTDRIGRATRNWRGKMSSTEDNEDALAHVVAVEEEGELSQSEKNRIVSYLDRIAPELRCEVCGQDNWAINDTLASPLMVRGDQNKSSTIPSKAHPCAMLHCLVCGNTKFFSMYVINEQPSLAVDESTSSGG